MNFRVCERGRVLIFDQEARPSSFWYPGATTGEITAFGWKWTDESEPHVLLLTRTGSFVTEAGRRLSAKRAYEAFRAVLTGAALVVGHNIRTFDLPLFQAGLLRLDLPTLPTILSSDTLRDYPKRRDMSASLENLVKMYGLDDDGGKRHMSQIDWERANRLTPEGIGLACERVVSDVLLQERLHGYLLEHGLLAAPKVWRP